MSTFEIKMPKMGESVQEATITKWFVEKGQMIEEDEPILEIATDKVDSEVPSPVEGKIIDIRFAVDDVVPVGEVVAVIDLTGEGEVVEDGDQSKAESKTEDAKAEVEDKSTEQSKEENSQTGENDLNQKSERFYSPLVKSIAAKENVSFEELESIEGSGKNGRVQKKDILTYIENRGSQPKSAGQSKPQSSGSAPSPIKPSVSSSDEIIQMDRMRKVIAERMVSSKHTAAHVTSMVEADVENVVQWRNMNKNSFQQREGIKLTFMPIFIEAVSKALKDFPLINVAVDGDSIIVKKDHNIGIAVALPGNNLIVPVIKKADHKSMTGLAHELSDLATRARENKLNLDEIQGGTFSISNFGSFGNVMGTPIINQPESAILAVGTIEKKPAVVETEYGDIIVPRHKMFLSLTYDHRVIDGALGGAFVRRIADYLEQFDKNRTL
ncbi:MAG: diapophytoene dehydrogenase [Salinivirgaceae bacterium]|nr:MAG: diapophytoene dehydrogenase [Salinivirgaceae bacterium]